MDNNSNNNRVSIELLSGLLSPHSEQRNGAETYYQSLSVLDRCRSLLELLVAQQQAALSDTQEWLLAVLLRREILKCTDAALLHDMMDPLLRRVSSPTPSNTATTANTIRLQLGHCCAEICATLSMIGGDTTSGSSSSSSSEEAMNKILQALSHLCCQGDIPSLRIVAELADRSPVPFARVAAPSLPQLIAACCQSDNNGNNSMELLEALTNVLVGAAIATEKGKDQQNNNRADPTSVAARLGTECFHLLASPTTAQALSCATNNNDGSQDCDSLSKILQHWSHAATACPSLFAGNEQVLQCVVTSCLQIVSAFQKNIHNKDNDDSYSIHLSCLQVIASLLEVDDTKRSILGTMDEPTLQSMIITPVVTTCVECIAMGVDDDIESWALQTPSSSDDSGLDNWEEDDVAIYSEELLESILHSLGGGLAFPVVLPLVETLLSKKNNDGDEIGWKYQRAALSILECCLSGAPISFLQHQPVAIQAALAFSPQNNNINNNIRVQYQAIRLLGAMCENHNRIPQKQYTAPILQMLAQAAVTASASLSFCPKLSCMSCMGMVSFCRGGGGDPEDEEEKRDEMKSLVVPYLSDLLSALVSGPMSVPMNTNANSAAAAAVIKQKAVGAMACLAEATGEAFVPFYHTVMPQLLGCCSEAHGSSSSTSSGSHEVAMLMGSSLEAATIIGQALGPDHGCDVFRKDAQQILQFATTILQQQQPQQHNNHNNNLSQIPMDQVLSACARIASVMGMEYAPFVDVVLPHLLERAVEPPDVSLSEGTEADLDQYRDTQSGPHRPQQRDNDDGTESMTMTVPGRGITKVTINTTKIQEKAMAARAVYEHAQALGEGGGLTPQHLKQCLDAFVPLCGFQFSSEVRSTSAQTVAAVFEAACSSCLDNGTPQTYLPVIVQAMTKQIGKENDVTTSDDGMETLFAFSDALSEVYYSVYSRCRSDTTGAVAASFFGGSHNRFSLDHAHSSVRVCMKAIKECLKRRDTIRNLANHHSAAVIGEDERHEIQMTLKEEEKLLIPLVDSVGYTLKLFRSEFIPIFEQEIVPVLGLYLTNNNDNKYDDARAKFSAVCLFDDCVEHCGTSGADRFSSMLLQGILTITNQNPDITMDDDLLRACIYGIAQIARYTSTNIRQQILAPHAEQVFHLLLSVVKNRSKGEEEDNDDYNAVLENAVSALASLTLIGESPPFAATTNTATIPPREELINMFLDHLPLREDEDEAKICHEGFCDMIENGSIGSLDAQTSPKILRIIGEIFQDEDGDTTTTAHRLHQILMRMQRDIPPHHLQKCFVSLRPDIQQVLNGVMNHDSNHNPYHPVAGPKIVTP